jgi:hypothetical protein
MKMNSKEERSMVAELVKAKACLSEDEALRLIDNYMTNPFVIPCRNREAGIKAIRILQWGTKIKIEGGDKDVE